MRADARTAERRRIPAPARMLAVSTGFALLSGGPAFAAGMPQLDFSNPLTTGQLFWGAVIFFVLYLLLSRSALPRVSSVLAERRRRIDGDLDAARDARDEAGRAIDELRRARREAAAESSRIVEGVMEEARREVAARNAETAARLDREIARAEAEVERARTEAMATLPVVATDAATALLERLTGRGVEPGRVDHEVSRVLAARGA